MLITSLITIPFAFTGTSELAIVNGEDLTRYRAASKSIFQLARSLVWGEKVERLGLDELFMGMYCLLIMSENKKRR